MEIGNSKNYRQLAMRHTGLKTHIPKDIQFLDHGGVFLELGWVFCKTYDFGTTQVYVFKRIACTSESTDCKLLGKYVRSDNLKNIDRHYTKQTA